MDGISMPAQLPHTHHASSEQQGIHPLPLFLISPQSTGLRPTSSDVMNKKHKRPQQ